MSWKQLLGAGLVAGALGCGPIACFPSGTRIATPRGPRRIEDLAVGDLVWAWDDAAGALRACAVTAVMPAAAEELILLGAGDSRVAVTAEHPFATPERGWVAAGTLLVGDRVQLQAGECLTPASIYERQRLRVDPTPVWNLTVAELACYVAEGFLVHNKPPRNREPADRDGDGFARGVDCDDDAPVVNPAAVEVCRDDGIDNDCDSAREDEDSDCKPAARELVLLGGGSQSRLAVYLGPTHDAIVEVGLDPPPAAGETQLVTEPTTVDALTGPLARLQGQLAGHPVTINMVAFLYARQLIPDGAYRYDLQETGKWLLFGAGADYYLAWTRVEQTDPVQVVAVSCKDPLPDRPMRVPLPVRPLKVGELFELDLGGGVKRSLQVMAEAIPARGW